MRESQDFKAIQIFLKSLSSDVSPAELSEPAFTHLQSKLGKDDPTLDDIRAFLALAEADVDDDEKRNIELSIKAVELRECMRGDGSDN